MRRVSDVLLILILGGVVALLGCASSGSSGGEESSGTGTEFDDGSAGMTDSDAGRTSVTSLQTVYFDYDRAEIRTDARNALQGNAQAINANQGWGTITVEGHCDERGSEEYNLALGNRRANAVKRYLVDLGVPSARLRTVSFGEARPAVPGHDESAYRYNRRSEFKAGS